MLLGDDLDHDEEIKYSAVRRDTDNSKYKPFTNVPSSTCHVDSFNRTVNIDSKDSLACSSTMVQTNFHTNVTSYVQFRCLAVCTLHFCWLINVYCIRFLKSGVYKYLSLCSPCFY